MMLYFILIILLLFVAMLFLHLRFKLHWQDESNKILFIGLGHTGVHYDFSVKTIWLVFKGNTVKQFQNEKTKKSASKPKKEKASKIRKKKKVNWWGVLEITPAVLYYTGEYFLALIKSLQWEEVKAEIEAGFDQPDLTGITFGYYQAALAAAPSVFNKIEYHPVWHEQTFSGSARLSVSMPLYQLFWKTGIWIIKLPIRKIIKLAIGYKRGVRDDK